MDAAKSAVAKPTQATISKVSGANEYMKFERIIM